MVLFVSEENQISENFLRQLYNAGWSSPEARRAHNPKVAGSNPVPAIGERRHVSLLWDVAFFITLNSFFREDNFC